jgi:hypothetical protein
VQLPLTAGETARANQLVLADPAKQAEIGAQYQAITGAPLTEPEKQLSFSVLIFRADSMPGAHPGAAECGLHRCAQLLIAAQNDVVVNLLPIVDLSVGAVVSTGQFTGN